jgi:hypothetical protein
MANKQSEGREMLRAALGPTADCPSIEDLEQVLTEQISLSTAVARHVHSCSYCRTEMELLRAFYKAQDPPSEQVKQVVARLQANSKKVFPKIPAAETPSWWERAFSARHLVQASLAMAAVLLVAAVMLKLNTAKSPSLEAANQTTHEVFRSGSFDLVEPVGDIQEPPKEIRWDKVDGAATYQVRVFEVDRSELWKVETQDTRIDVPPTLRDRIVPAKTLFCQVDAFNSSGTKLSGTGLIRFRLVQNAGNHQ